MTAKRKREAPVSGEVNKVEEEEIKIPSKKPAIVLSALQKIEQEEYLDTSSDTESECSELTDEDGEGVPSGESPELIGFAVCAQETINFLRMEGFREDDPLITTMQTRLLQQLMDYQSALTGKVSARAKSV